MGKYKEAVINLLFNYRSINYTFNFKMFTRKPTGITSLTLKCLLGAGPCNPAFNCYQNLTGQGSSLPFCTRDN